MNTLYFENRLVQLGQNFCEAFRENGLNAEETKRTAEDYCNQILKLVPFGIKDGFLKHYGYARTDIDEIYKLAPYKFIGILSYAIAPNAFEEAFKDNFNKFFDENKYFTIFLPTREENVAGGSYIVGVFELVS